MCSKCCGCSYLGSLWWWFWGKHHKLTAKGNLGALCQWFASQMSWSQLKHLSVTFGSWKISLLAVIQGTRLQMSCPRPFSSAGSEFLLLSPSTALLSPVSPGMLGAPARARVRFGVIPAGGLSQQQPCPAVCVWVSHCNVFPSFKDCFVLAFVLFLNIFPVNLFWSVSAVWAGAPQSPLWLE